VRLDHADDDIFTSAVPSHGLAEHVVSLAHPWRVAEEELEYTLFLLRRRLFQPLFRSLLHAAIVVDGVEIVDVEYNALVNKLAGNVLVRFVECIAIVAVIVLVYRRVVSVNPTTVALTFLVAVLIISAFWGLRYSVFVAVLVTLAFNFFFLPPYGRLIIADPQNWVALVAFLVTAIIASHLSERARREALRANQRRREIERLYGFSRQLLTTEHVLELLNSLPRFLVESFGARAAALFIPGRDDVYYSGLDARELNAERLNSVTARGEPVVEIGPALCFAPLRIGIKTAGAFGISGTVLSRETLEALGTLMAIAIERTGAVENLGKAEASKESEKLRSAILDSVSHEFRTPLTSIKASVTTMLSNGNLETSQREELLTVINEETDRLNHLVGEAAEMAQLDGNQVELNRELHPIRDAIEQALEDAKQRLADHPVDVSISDGLPPVPIDLERIVAVLVHLLENAGKYSPPKSPIRITVESHGAAVMVSVSDRGPGIDDFEQALIFDKFYRGRNERARIQGTGLGLAIAKAVVEAHGGTIGVTSQVGQGSVFHFTLPTS
jgi:two-component system, OmpR family, sensor histidine kinase KdpD